MASIKSSSLNPTTIRILCLAPSKTGTSSVQAALERLGHPTFHGWDLFDSEARCKLWYDLVLAKFGPEGGVGSELYKKVDWKGKFAEVLEGYEAVCDTPCYYFWRELIEAYPEAKIILVERDIDKWYTSFHDNVTEAMFAPVAILIVRYLEPIVGTHIGRMQTMAFKGYWEGETMEEIDANSKPIYRRHYGQVREAVPEERLLNFKLGEGWKPLCDFLGTQVPSEEFPWVNEQAEYKKKVWEFQKKFLVKDAGWWMLGRVGMVATVLVAFLVYRMKI